MTKIISAILAVKEIFKTIKGLFDAYVSYKRQESNKRMDKAIDKGDTIGIEEELNSPNAGKPTKFRDGVNVRKKGKTD